jgi:hypothetical protein
VARLVGLVAAMVFVSACASDGAPVQTGRRVEARNGVSVVVPDRWTADAASAARLSAFVHGRWIDEGCSHGDRAHVGVRVDVVPEQLATAESFGPRPDHFTFASGDGVASGAADQPCGSSSQTIRFVENGRHIDIYVDFGLQASTRDRTAVYKLLDSLRVSPAT